MKAPGLDKTEVIRLRGIIAGCKVYKEMLADYMDYCGLEAELLELSAKYKQLAEKNSAFRPNRSTTASEASHS